MKLNPYVVAKLFQHHCMEVLQPQGDYGFGLGHLEGSELAFLLVEAEGHVADVPDDPLLAGVLPAEEGIADVHTLLYLFGEACCVLVELILALLAEPMLPSHRVEP